MRLGFTLLLALGACSRALSSAPEMEPAADAGALPDAEEEEDIEIEPSECDALLYFPDADKDGAGDATAPGVESCEAMEGYVTDASDCNDNDDFVGPGEVEVCDGLDNDCNPETVETCPNGCQPRLRDGHAYLFCDDNRNWTNAQALCASQAMYLVRLDDQPEAAWVDMTQAAVLGDDHYYIGANDRGGEGVWTWDDGSQFWQGDEGGSPIAVSYEDWQSGEPNDEPGNSDCAIVAQEGGWRDRECGDSYNFVCERYTMIAAE